MAQCDKGDELESVHDDEESLVTVTNSIDESSQLYERVRCHGRSIAFLVICKSGFEETSGIAQSGGKHFSIIA